MKNKRAGVPTPALICVFSSTKNMQVTYGAVNICIKGPHIDVECVCRNINTAVSYSCHDRRVIEAVVGVAELHYIPSLYILPID